VWRLHRQRRRFLSLMTSSAPAPGASCSESPVTQQPAIDNEWLQEAIARVEAHMSDDDYSVEHLARDLCMSRMTLYRRIQSSTGQKPSEFIRTIRLRRAAGLLREGRLSITEISYDTGFSSVSYFSRCFRTMYGVPPTLFGRTTTAGEPASDESPN
jgi:transcriptional regulator GlxA family with amidase domain